MFYVIALVAGAPDYQPVILAVAGVIVLCGPAVAAFLQGRDNGKKLDAVVSATDGINTGLQNTADRLHAKIDGMHREATAAAGGTTPAPDIAARVPLWDQLHDPNPDGAADRYATSDCGEECACMVARACRGVIVAEGDARMQMGGPLRSGLTNGQDLCTLLTSWSFSPRLIEAGSAATRAVVAPLLAAGHPVICLGEWLSPGVLHWVVLTGESQGYMRFADPWHGQRRSLTVAAWDGLYRGAAVDAGESVRS